MHPLVSTHWCPSGPTDQVTKKGPLMVSLGLYASKLAATKALTSQLDDMQVRSLSGSAPRQGA